MDFRRRISRQRSSRVEEVPVNLVPRAHRRQRSGWSRIPKWPAWAQIALVIGLTGFLWFVKWLFTTRDNNWQDVNLWLKNNRLQQYHALFWKSGKVTEWDVGCFLISGCQGREWAKVFDSVNRWRKKYMRVRACMFACMSNSAIHEAKGRWLELPS